MSNQLFALQGVNNTPWNIIHTQSIVYIKSHILKSEEFAHTPQMHAKRYGEIHIVRLLDFSTIDTNSFEKLKSFKPKKYFDNLLKDTNEFISVSQSAIVNIKFIDKIDKKNFQLYMRDGETIQVSEHRMSALFSKFIKI